MHNDELARLGIPDPISESRSDGRKKRERRADDSTQRFQSSAVVKRLSDVQPEQLEWLWPGRIPLGKVTLLAGDPGLGKSFVTLDMAARVSSGRGWPDNYAAGQPAGSVILFSAEDDLADTVRPRLDRHHADPERIVAVQGVQWFELESDRSGTRHFTLDHDLPELEKLIEETKDVRLVVVDPISAYCGRVDSHKNAEVRAMLARLAELAAKHRVAVVAVTHLSKGAGEKAIYRAMGSLAFIAAARAGWLFTRDAGDPARRLMLPLKMNLCEDPTGLAFAIHDGVVAWEAEPVHASVEDVIAAELESSSDRERRSELQDAIDWLQAVLENGSVKAGEIRKLARESGISEATLRRAKKRAGVESNREGFGKGSVVLWALPRHRCSKSP